MLLVITGLEVNPGPNIFFYIYSFAVWNLDSIMARNKSKIPLIESLNAVYQYSLFGLCETYLTKDISDSEISISGFSPSPFRADCKDTEGKRKGGVCLFYNENLPIKQRLDFKTQIDETIVAEIQLKNKKTFFVLTYKTPSMPKDQFEKYMSDLQSLYDELLKEKPSIIVLSGDFNSKSPLFWDEETIETAEGKKLSDFMMVNGLEQLINEPTHFQTDCLPHCVDLILTNNPSAFVNSEVIPSPDELCKHQIIQGNINFSVPCPPPYKRTFWKYDRADTEMIKESIKIIDWKTSFQSKTVDEMTSCFTDTLIKIMERYIPHRTVTIDNKDAPWVTPSVKCAINRNKRVYSKWKSRGRKPEDRNQVNKVQNETNKIIQEAKDKYHFDLGDKLCDARNGQKVMWTAFNRLLNKR